MLNMLRFKYGKSWIHRVEDILLGFEPKDAGSIPAGSVIFPVQGILMPGEMFPAIRTTDNSSDGSVPAENIKKIPG